MPTATDTVEKEPKNTTAESWGGHGEHRQLRKATLEKRNLEKEKPRHYKGDERTDTALKKDSPKGKKRARNSPAKQLASRKSQKSEDAEKSDFEKGAGTKDKGREETKRTQSPTKKKENDSEPRVKLETGAKGKEHYTGEERSEADARPTSPSKEVKKEQRNEVGNVGGHYKEKDEKDEDDELGEAKPMSSKKGINPEDVIKMEQVDQKIDAEKSLHPNALEKGHVYFFYRPRVQTKEAHSSDDISRLYVLLKPLSTRPAGVSVDKPLGGEEVIQGKIRLVLVPKKKLPDIKDHSRYWGFVRKASKEMSSIDDILGEEHYETKTRGERFIESCRPIGAGVYSIIMHHKSTHLAYILNVPIEPGDIQKAFNIRKEGSFIFSVKNPETSNPPQAGLGGGQKAKFPTYLQEIFHGRRFVSTDPVEFLDYDGCELLLIGAHDDAANMGEASTELEHLALLEEEKVVSVGRDSTIFTELRLDGEKFRPEPLFGMWA